MDARRIALVSDAYFPQVSGVATTLKATKHELEKMGHEARIISPRDFSFVVPMPGYSEIKLAVNPFQRLAKMLDEFAPDALHISVEGPLGHAAQAYAARRGRAFTTAYHTRFPEYVQVRSGIPLSFSYAVLRRFHRGSSAVMVATETLRDELASRGFERLALWPRGVDTDLFTPDERVELPGTRPISMYMGRVAVEKNLDAFLRLDIPGTKYVVGDGPARASLQKKYPQAVFTGYKFEHELARHLAAADVFVFPSLTDTLGLVMLEANACGVPVAALPSQASAAVIEEGVNGAIDTDLRAAISRALALPRVCARESALRHSWRAATETFLNNLVHERS